MRQFLPTLKINSRLTCKASRGEREEKRKESKQEKWGVMNLFRKAAYFIILSQYNNNGTVLIWHIT